MSSPDKATSKRSRAEDQESASIQRSDCRYQQCRRPTLEKGRGMRHAFCGLAHRDFFMASLADMFCHGERDDIAHEEHEQKCKLPGCDKEKALDPEGYEFDFCRKAHALKYIEYCTRQWGAKGRLCKFEFCYHHVSVDEMSKTCHEFCSFEHAKLAAGAKGRAAQKSPNDPGKLIVNEGNCSASNDIPQRSLSQDTSHNLQHVSDKVRGYHVKLHDKDLEDCLRTTLIFHPGDHANEELMLNFSVGTNIVAFHPWELVSEYGGFRARYFLFMNDTKHGTQRSTKDGFGWKQTSKAHPLNDKMLQVTYFWYELRDQDSRNDHLGDHVRAYRECKGTKKKGQQRWRMHEYVLPDHIMEEITQGQWKLKGPTGKPVIWKIFQNRKGKPVWPPVQHHNPFEEQSDPVQIEDQSDPAAQQPKSSMSSPLFGDEPLDNRSESPLLAITQQGDTLLEHCPSMSSPLHGDESWHNRSESSLFAISQQGDTVLEDCPTTSSPFASLGQMDDFMSLDTSHSGDSLENFCSWYDDAEDILDRIAKAPEMQETGLPSLFEPEWSMLCPVLND